MSLAPLNRRTFLRAAGVAIALPLLDAMLPIGYGAEAKATAMCAKRMLLIGRPLGMHTPFLFPEKAGKDYEATPYLKPLEAFRGEFTVFSGMSHRGYNAGHGTEAALLTGVGPEGMRAGDVRNTISLDQEVATKIAADTRYASLALGGGDLCWNSRGVKLPSESRATMVFKQLFIDGTPAEVAAKSTASKTARAFSTACAIRLDRYHSRSCARS